MKPTATSPRAGAVGLAVAALALGTAACTSSGTTSTTGTATASSSAPSAPTSSTTATEPSTAPTPSVTTTPTATAGAVSQPFGPGCSSLPNGGQLPSGSATQELSSVPQLSQLAAALGVAGLGDRLDSASDITVFAPDDSAFSSLGQVRLAQLLASPSQVGDVLSYHVVPERLTPDQLAGTHQTLEGASLTVAGSGEDFTVNGTPITCGGIQADNAVIYVVPQVLSIPG